MASKDKRRCLFTKYEFEIGVLTLPAYFCLLIVGFVTIGTKIGQAFALLGLIGTVAATFSIVKGYEEIKW
ncbi:MAG: hypothetical protein KAW41_05850 [Candidatus Diapherotrites archaeon]|nr:hypothetical protein [Candidatus Diapherotrites archaeon]